MYREPWLSQLFFCLFMWSHTDLMKLWSGLCRGHTICCRTPFLSLKTVLYDSELNVWGQRMNLGWIRHVPDGTAWWIRIWKFLTLKHTSVPECSFTPAVLLPCWCISEPNLSLCNYKTLQSKVRNRNLFWTSHNIYGVNIQKG